MKRMNKLNSLDANPTKWSNTLKQFVGNLRTNCLSVLDYFAILALKALKGVMVLQDQKLKMNARTERIRK